MYIFNRNIGFRFIYHYLFQTPLSQQFVKPPLSGYIIKKSHDCDVAATDILHILLSILCIKFYAFNYMYCLLCIVFYSLFSMYCISSILLYALYFMHCILSIVFYALHSMHCMLCIAFYALYFMHCKSTVYG